MPYSIVPEPWHSFLTELDQTATGAVELHCMGGFVITQLYGLKRPTADVDVLYIGPDDQREPLLQKGRRSSALHRKYGVYLDYVTVADYPCDYETRLSEIFHGLYKNLKLFALDPYDLALTKLTRNIERDRADVKHLARTVPLELGVLKQRYLDELRPFATGDPNRHDLTLELWIGMIKEERGENPP